MRAVLIGCIVLVAAVAELLVVVASHRIGYADGYRMGKFDTEWECRPLPERTTP